MVLPRRLFFIFLLFCLVNPVATGDVAWIEKSEATRKLMQEMDKTINQVDRNKAYHDYMKFFARELQAYGLLETGVADLEYVKQHYNPVFEYFDDGSLVTDTLVVAGNMAAQRYHSLFTLNGDFDGVSYKGKLVAIRGFTFFEFNENGQIIRRWSNHDHAYRMEQILGASGKESGTILSKRLNGPGLSAQKVSETIRALVAANNRIHDPELRKSATMAIFSPAVKVWGVTKSVAGYDELSRYFSDIWKSFPDLVFIPGDLLSAWSFGAVILTGHGTPKGNIKSTDTDVAPVKITIELILHFNDLSKIDLVYLYQHPLD